MRITYSLLFLICFALLSCKSDSQNKYQSESERFLRKIEAGDFLSATKMMHGDFVEKYNKMFNDDMALINELIKKNGWPKHMEIKENPTNFLAASAIIDLGKLDNTIIDAFLLHINFIVHDPSEIYGYRIERKIGR